MLLADLETAALAFERQATNERLQLEACQNRERQAATCGQTSTSQARLMRPHPSLSRSIDVAYDTRKKGDMP